MNPTSPPHHASRKLPAASHVSASHCLRWLLAGWQSLAQRPVPWLLAGLLTFLALLVCVLLAPIPIVGPMLPIITLILSMAGMLRAAEHQAQGAVPQWADIVQGVQTHTAHLVLLGVLFSLPLVVLALMSYLAIGGSLLVGLLGAALGSAVQGIVGGLAAFATFMFASWTIFLIGWSLLLLALLFAPALILFHNATPLDAMRLSFSASMKNIAAILGFGVLLYILFLLALSLAGLGTIVLIPVFAGALYQAYRDIFCTPALPAPEASADASE